MPTNRTGKEKKSKRFYHPVECDNCYPYDCYCGMIKKKPEEIPTKDIREYR